MWSQEVSTVFMYPTILTGMVMFSYMEIFGSKKIEILADNYFTLT